MQMRSKEYAKSKYTWSNVEAANRSATTTINTTKTKPKNRWQKEIRCAFGCNKPQKTLTPHHQQRVYIHLEMTHALPNCFGNEENYLYTLNTNQMTHTKSKYTVHNTHTQFYFHRKPIRFDSPFWHKQFSFRFYFNIMCNFESNHLNYWLNTPMNWPNPAEFEDFQSKSNFLHSFIFFFINSF